MQTCRNAGNLIDTRQRVSNNANLLRHLPFSSFTFSFFRSALMKTQIFLSAILAAAFVAPAFAAPILTVIPQGQQAGNWVWEVDVTPDLALSGPTGTPLALELGFRLTGDPLVSVTNLTPVVFDTSNPGTTIFGWETLYTPVGGTPKAEGIEANCTGCTVINLTTFPPTGAHPSTIVPGTTNEIFSALGSANIVTPGAIPLLKIIATGPGTGGPVSSTLQWLGAYGGKGRISQFSGNNAVNFDTYSGSLTQSVPEPATLGLVALAGLIVAASKRRRLVA